MTRFLKKTCSVFMVVCLASAFSLSCGKKTPEPQNQTPTPALTIKAPPPSSGKSGPTKTVTELRTAPPVQEKKIPPSLPDGKKDEPGTRSLAGNIGPAVTIPQPFDPSVPSPLKYDGPSPSPSGFAPEYAYKYAAPSEGRPNPSDSTFVPQETARPQNLNLGSQGGINTPAALLARATSPSSSGSPDSLSPLNFPRVDVPLKPAEVSPQRPTVLPPSPGPLTGLQVQLPPSRPPVVGGVVPVKKPEGSSSSEKKGEKKSEDSSGSEKKGEEKPKAKQNGTEEDGKKLPSANSGGSEKKDEGGGAGTPWRGGDIAYNNAGGALGSGILVPVLGLNHGEYVLKFVGEDNAGWSRLSGFWFSFPDAWIGKATTTALTEYEPYLKAQGGWVRVIRFEKFPTCLRAIRVDEELVPHERKVCQGERDYESELISRMIRNDYEPNKVFNWEEFGKAEFQDFPIEEFEGGKSVSFKDKLSASRNGLYVFLLHWPKREARAVEPPPPAQIEASSTVASAGNQPTVVPSVAQPITEVKDIATSFVRAFDFGATQTNLNSPELVAAAPKMANRPGDALVTASPKIFNSCIFYSGEGPYFDQVEIDTKEEFDCLMDSIKSQYRLVRAVKIHSPLLDAPGGASRILSTTVQ